MSYRTSKPISRSKPADPPVDNSCGEDQEAAAEAEQGVSSHLFIKPAHSTGTLDKAVVLRRIRHRKRVNKVRNAVQALLSSPFSPPQPSNTKTAPHTKRWVDDAFAAL